jgi:hypothetical protein
MAPSVRIGLILVTVVTSGCWANDLCRVETLASLPSPNGALIATQYDYGCGALSSFNTYVNIRGRGEEFDRSAGVVFNTTPGPVDLKIQWLSDESLSINAHCIRDCILRNTLQRQSFGKVKIAYRFENFR